MVVLFVEAALFVGFVGVESVVEKLAVLFVVVEGLMDLPIFTVKSEIYGGK